MHLVFVYGSLKRGFTNHRVIGYDARFIATTCTVSRKFKMVSLGPFPAVYPNGKWAIEGELYEVDDITLESLDLLESNGYLYEREEVLLETGDIAWMYVLCPWFSPQGIKNDRVKNKRGKTQVWLHAPAALAFVKDQFDSKK